LAEVCSWCQSEIVWDEEIGPEEHCPHCLNELESAEDYRTVNVHIDQDDEGDEDYESKVDRYISAQDEEMQCEYCQEFMILAGKQKIHKDQFQPYIPLGMKSAFLASPFSLNVYVCPSCFKMNYQLCEEDRMRVLR
jgi:DNA-directed RNA polymerase subunit RPC12/RpoP